MRGLGIVAMPHARSAVVAMVVRLGAAPRRLPEPAFYLPPPGVGTVQPVPLIMVNPEAGSATARIRAALEAFSQDRFRDTFNPKSRT
jgi:HPr kinase/phosphorylase